MQTLARLRHAQAKVVTVQRRLWLIQALATPVLALIGLAVVGAAVVLWRQRATSTGKHELPDTPGAHRVGPDDVGSAHLTERA
jgi:hypothetical protein